MSMGLPRSNPYISNKARSETYQGVFEAKSGIYGK